MKQFIESETKNVIKTLLEQNKNLNISDSDIYSLGKALFLIDNMNRVLNKGDIKIIFSRKEEQAITFYQYNYYLTISNSGIELVRHYGEDYGRGSEYFSESINVINNQILYELNNISDSEEYKIEAIKGITMDFQHMSSIAKNQYIWNQKILNNSISISCGIDNFKLNKVDSK